MNTQNIFNLIWIFYAFFACEVVRAEGVDLLSSAEIVDRYWFQNGRESISDLYSDDNESLKIDPGAGDILSRFEVRDFRLEFEFKIPNMPNNSGQQRGNSGLYIHGLYEVQILDSEQPSNADPSQGCMALYKLKAPDRLPQCLPEVWNYVIIDFKAPRISNLVVRPYFFVPAFISVWFNHALMHKNIAMSHGTGSARKKPIKASGPLLLQDHGAQVEFRRMFLSALPSKVF